MAMPFPPGLTPQEVAFLCEMELVTVIPRQRLEALDLLGGPTPTLAPPHRGNVPLWLALLLKRQRRANIMPPPWLHRDSLETILDLETRSLEVFSPQPKLPPLPTHGPGVEQPAAPPFLPFSIADAAPGALPYHWLEMGELLLAAAQDDIEDAEHVRRLLRDLREVRASKIRAGVDVLDAAGGVKMNGVGAMEVAENRAFIGGVIDSLRRIGASREQARRESEAEGSTNGFGRSQDYDDDDDMDI